MAQQEYPTRVTHKSEMCKNAQRPKKSFPKRVEGENIDDYATTVSNKRVPQECK